LLSESKSGFKRGVVEGMRYEVIQERLDKGGSFNLEILKLICEITDRLFYIESMMKEKLYPIEQKEPKSLADFSSLIEEVKPKKRGRPFKKRWQDAKI